MLLLLVLWLRLFHVLVRIVALIVLLAILLVIVLGSFRSTLAYLGTTLGRCLFGRFVGLDDVVYDITRVSPEYSHHSTIGLGSDVTFGWILVVLSVEMCEMTKTNEEVMIGESGTKGEEIYDHLSADT